VPGVYTHLRNRYNFQTNDMIFTKFLRKGKKTNVRW